MKNYLPAILLLLLFIIGCSSEKPVSGWQIMETQGSCQARSECAFAEATGKLYLMGGRKIQSVDIYDPASNSWSQGADAPIEFHHFQAVTFMDKIYVMGALTGDYPREDPVPVIHIYDPAVDQWILGDSIPAHRRRGAAGVAVVGDVIYMACGIQDGHYDGHVAWMDRYDPKTGSWEELPDAPRPRDHFQLAVVGNEIYVAGGRTSFARTGHVFDLTISEVDVFDLTASEWSAQVTTIPTERAGCTAFAVDGQFVVIGGESGSMEEGHYDAEVFNTAEGTWYSSHKLVDGRHGTQAVLYQDNVYMAAGSGNRGGGPELTSIEVIDASTLFAQ